MNRREFAYSIGGLLTAAGWPVKAEEINARLRSQTQRAFFEARVGQRFAATGPCAVKLKLDRVTAHQGRHSDQQFYLDFSANGDCEEGLYLLENGEDSLALFLQAVPGEPRRLEAACNHAV